MKATKLQKNVGQFYLTIVPILTIVFGLSIGYISYKIYLPIWLLNVVCMVGAMWQLGGAAFKSNDAAKKQMALCGVLFILPTLLTSMFFGLGAPPYESPQLWVASITEQRTRYYFLLAAGVFIAFGFAVLKKIVKNDERDTYAVIGDSAIKMAMPIFFIDMSFWGFYLTRFYQYMVTAGIDKVPEWVIPLRNQFYYVNIIVCGLIYLGTAAFAMALRKKGLFKKSAANAYVMVSLLFFVFDVLPATLPDPFATLNFIVSIPAIPFYFAYYMGINLLKLAGRQN